MGLTDGSGARITHLVAGTFTLAVDDKSGLHDFHLKGPGGVDVATTTSVSSALLPGR